MTIYDGIFKETAEISPIDPENPVAGGANAFDGILQELADLLPAPPAVPCDFPSPVVVSEEVSENHIITKGRTALAQFFNPSGNQCHLAQAPYIKMIRGAVSLRTIGGGAPYTVVVGQSTTKFPLGTI